MTQKKVTAQTVKLPSELRSSVLHRLADLDQSFQWYVLALIEQDLRDQRLLSEELQAEYHRQQGIPANEEPPTPHGDVGTKSFGVVPSSSREFEHLSELLRAIVHSGKPRLVSAIAQNLEQFHEFAMLSSGRRDAEPTVFAGEVDGLAAEVDRAGGEAEAVIAEAETRAAESRKRAPRRPRIGKVG